MCRSSTTCLQKLSVAQHIGKYGWCWDVHTNVFIITAITVRYIESMQNISAFCENTLIRFAFGLLLHKLLGRISVRRILQKQNRSMLNGWIINKCSQSHWLTSTDSPLFNETETLSEPFLILILLAASLNAFSHQWLLNSSARLWPSPAVSNLRLALTGFTIPSEFLPIPSPVKHDDKGNS